MITKILYTSEATAQGGRGGHVGTSDGRLDLPLDVRVEMGGPGGPGTNPEQLFAAGYAACFQSALMRVAAAQRLAIPRSKLIARVGIGPASEGGFGLSVALDLEAPGLDRAGGDADGTGARALPLLAGDAWQHRRRAQRRRHPDRACRGMNPLSLEGVDPACPTESFC
jgi:lipoyl-dependent peroxiredoxin